MTPSSPARTPLSAIVLAGGRSRRFGRDKLREPLGGRPLLHRAVDAVSQIASEVVVVTAPGVMPDVPAGVRVVADETPYAGPLAGCLTGLLAVREPLAVIVGGDMPSLQPPVLELLVRTLEHARVDAAALEHLGRTCPLPLAVRTGTGSEAARRLLAERERRLRSILEHVLVQSIAEAAWRPLDPEALTLRDVDEPADLDALDPAT